MHIVFCTISNEIHAKSQIVESLGVRARLQINRFTLHEAYKLTTDCELVTYHCYELNVAIYFASGQYICCGYPKDLHRQGAQLSQKNHMMHLVIEYFAKSLEVIGNCTI